MSRLWRDLTIAFYFTTLPSVDEIVPAGSDGRVIASSGMSTARKMAIARWLLAAVRGARLLAGRHGTEVVCRRGGVRWSLDLREGVQLALYLGLYERVTSRRLRELVPPGAVVMDVGANIGAHTLPLALAVGAAGRVVAVEPTAAAFERLARNIALNPEIGSRIVPVRAALGAQGGTLASSYYSAWPLHGADSLHPVHLGQPQATTEAGFFTLDDLVASLSLPAVAAIKIDVDGGELAVLRGAVGVIERHKPIVLFEVCPYLLTDPANSAAELLTFFTSRGYELLDERTLRPVGVDPARIIAGIPAHGGRNLIARVTRG
jgi:FkbM family methyltransferase